MKIKLLHIAICLLFLVSSSYTHAQTFRDSIINLISKETDSITIAKLYGKLAAEETNSDTLKKYSNLSIDYCGNNMGIKAVATSNLAYAASTEGNWEHSLQLYQHALSMARYTNDSMLLATITLNIGTILEALNEIPEAMANIRLAIDMFKQINNKAWEIWAYRQLCHICTNAKMFIIAEKYCDEMNQICQTSNDPLDKLTAFISYAQMNTFKAESQHHDSLRRILHRTLSACDSIDRIIYENKCTNFDCMTALNESYLERCKAYILLAMADDRYYKKNSDSAQKYLNLADKWYTSTGDSVQLSEVELCHAWLLFAQKNYAKALEAANNYKISSFTSKYLKEHLYDLLSHSHFQLGHYKEAFQWQTTLNKFQNFTTEETKLAQVSERLLSERLDEFDSAEKLLKRKNEELSTSVSDKQSKLILAIIALGVSIFAIIVVCISVVRKRRINKLLKTKNQILLQKQEEIIQQQGIITSQKEKVERYNSTILQSIRYARHIQRMALPDAEDIKILFPESFLSYMPKDIVSGDFYYVTRCGNFSIIVIADCTGHGVPGGFLSMFGISAIKEILSRPIDNVMPGAILDSMRDFIKEAFSGDSEIDESGDETFSTADGMDMSVCAVNLKTREVRYAGAYHSAYVWSNGTISRLKGDRMPIGRHIKEDGAFTTISQTLKQGDMLYLMTDGIQGQMGGLSGTKFMTKRLLQFFAENASSPVEKQKETFENIMHDWMQNTIQVDDMTLAGIRIL